jgi:aspartate aminotransferase
MTTRLDIPTSDAEAPPGVPTRRLSQLADSLAGSEILRIAGEVREMRERGARICDLTIGDFAMSQFPVPELLVDETVAALHRGETKYPPSSGLPVLRESVRGFYERALGLRYPIEGVLITCGSRPGIYATYRTLVDPGDRVVYPVPSWNNNHYCDIVGAESVQVETSSEDAFLPRVEAIAPHLRGARLLVLNSPNNPTGNALTAEGLGTICDAVLAENARRGAGERPLYLMYDQVYWMLTFGDVRHVDPVSLRPEMREFTVYVDGISKAFAATGMRVGWLVGPSDVIAHMNTLLGHIGTWAPRAEQIATAALLRSDETVATYREWLCGGLRERLAALYDGIVTMRDDGLPVDAIEPMGAIYLSARFALHGRRTASGRVLRSNAEVRAYLLERAGVAVVPFEAFAGSDESGWYRLSCGAVSMEDIAEALPRLREAIEETEG